MEFEASILGIYVGKKGVAAGRGGGVEGWKLEVELVLF